ncbi:hypothetical protein NGM10_02480 [Halorussus salilacus]|uniref:hypothetical protein n=1 Tax=Halorussus salilacus TaxID=2953750 RepID=UPI00209DF98C|nr:hypothetical protein [Halorussus salilacus]USZ68617.1 hypothetical protein NGM10_02480 [Halorussus salilacus]
MERAVEDRRRLGRAVACGGGCCAVLCGAVLCGAVLCGAVRCCAVFIGTGSS